MKMRGAIIRVHPQGFLEHGDFLFPPALLMIHGGQVDRDRPVVARYGQGMLIKSF